MAMKFVKGVSCEEVLVFLVVLGTIHLSNAFAVIISVDKSIVEEKRSSFLFDHVYKSFNDEISIVEIKERNIPALSYIMHQIHNRCGGFFAYHSLEEAFDDVDQFSYNKSGETLVFADYSISEQELVNSTISKVQESRIRQSISHLSAIIIVFINLRRVFNRVIGSLNDGKRLLLDVRMPQLI